MVAEFCLVIAVDDRSFNNLILFQRYLFKEALCLLATAQYYVLVGWI